MSAVSFSSDFVKRDYSLTGPSARSAVETGLASAEWYHTEIPRKAMKELMQRSDGPAIRDTVLWLSLLIVTTAAGIFLWGSWWAVPFFFAYGTLYGSASDARARSRPCHCRPAHGPGDETGNGDSSQQPGGTGRGSFG